MAKAGAWLLVAAVLPLGCGYHLAGTETKVPGDIHSISIGQIENRSRQEGLEKILTFALEREFYERGELAVRENPGDGDGLITGTIVAFRSRPVSYDANENALQYETELTLDITLRRQADGKVLWKGRNLRAYDEYAVSPSAVVPSSSQFQQGTLDFSNLSQLSNVQLAETEQRTALQRIVRSIVRDVHDRILNNF